MSKIKKIARTILTIVIMTVIVWTWIYGYTLFQRPNIEETPAQIVTKLHNFYVSGSGYNSKDLYEKDLKTLWDIKQIIVDDLSYVDTLKYTAYQLKKWDMIDNDFLKYVDQTIMLAKDGLSKVPPPEYAGIDVSKLFWSDNKKSWSDSAPKGTWKLDFMKLLK